jgi:predicted ATP-binding protein involved in virulence
MTEQLQSPEGPRTFLEQIELSNYRCFAHLVVPMHPELTVLIARNGAGKTSVMDAIAIAFGTFVGCFLAGTGIGASHRDVRVRLTNPELREMEPQYPLNITAVGTVNGLHIEWSRNVNSSKSGTTIKDAKPLTSIGEGLQKAVTDNVPVVLPVLAYYGTGRLWKQKKVTEKKVFSSEFHSRTSGYQDCLDPASSYKFFLDWFRYAANANAEALNRQREQNVPQAELVESAYAGLIAAVRGAVDECLQSSGWQNLRYSFTHQSVVMEHPDHGILEVGQLSDGVRNMIALVADVAYRMVRLNSHFGAEAAKRTPGIVMIDEVDMHLHPEWQQQVLASLRRAFPVIQLIVTTHSPQVLSTVRKEHIRVLGINVDGENVAGEPLARTYGRSNADVLQATMGVTPEPPTEGGELLRRYMSLVEQASLDDPDISRWRAELVEIFGNDHPSLIRADMVARRRRALGDGALPPESNR